MVLVAVLLVFQAEVIDEPGAKMSRQVPQFDSLRRVSLSNSEPTVIASATLAGEMPQASEFPLPAAME